MAKASNKTLPGPLAEAERRMENGDVASARVLARQVLAEAAPGSADAVAALALSERTRLPRVVFVLLGLGTLFFFAMALLGAHRT